VKARILPNNVSFPSCHRVFIALRSYLYNNARYMLSTQENATHQTATSTLQGQISNGHKKQRF